MCTCWWIHTAWDCDVARAHLHVVRRENNPNQAWAKSCRQRLLLLYAQGPSMISLLTTDQISITDPTRANLVHTAAADFGDGLVEVVG